MVAPKERGPPWGSSPAAPIHLLLAASASEAHVCALPARGLGSLFYGFLILTWQKGSGGSARPCGECPEDPQSKDSWTIKRDLCL